MKKKLYILLCIIFLSVCVISYTVSGTTVEEILQQKKNELSNKIENTTTEIGEIEGNITYVSEQVDEINEKVSKYQQEINELNVKLLQLEVKIKDAQGQLKLAEENYQKQKNLFEKRIVAIYEAGDTVYLDVLLNAKSIEQFISSYYYLSEISKHDQELVNTVLRTKGQIETRKETLLKEQTDLKIVTSSKERTAITLKNTQAVRNSYLAQLNETQTKKQEELNQYEKDMEVLEKDMLETSLKSMGEEYIGGNLAWPAPGYTTITSPYGMRVHPMFHVLRLHTGVDIGTPEGSNIIAVNSGVVTLARFSQSYGFYVMVDHGGGVVTLYAHANELLVSVGDVVKTGDVIMKSGNTGYSTGPHLHFEVRINGNTVNPLPYITKTNDDKKTEKNIEKDLNNNVSNDITNV